MQQPPQHHLAQLNVGRIRYDIADPRMADFTDNLVLVNRIAEGCNTTPLLRQVG